MIHDQGVGDDRVNGPFGARCLALSHAIANDLAAAELDLFAIKQVWVTVVAVCRPPRTFGDQIPLDLDDQVGIRKAKLVAYGGAEHGGIVCAWDR